MTSMGCPRFLRGRGQHGEVPGAPPAPLISAKGCPLLAPLLTAPRGPYITPDLANPYPRFSPGKGFSSTSMDCPRFPRDRGKPDEVPGDPVLNPNRGLGLPISRTISHLAPRIRYYPRFVEFLASNRPEKGFSRTSTDCPRFPRDR